MCVASGDGIPDSEQLERTIGIGRPQLRPVGNQLVAVHGAPVPRERLQLEIQLVERDRSMVDHDLVDRPFLAHAP
jgi:hypothetical protein